ncbi:MAG: PQQ-dependent sugar dehydrogenase [Caldilineaceae bacterium]
MVSKTARLAPASPFAFFTLCLLLLALIGWLALGMMTLSPSRADAADQAITLALEPFATGLTQPTDIVNAGDDRLFVVEQPGMIRIVQADGALLSTPFLDIRDRVTLGSEQGLLGMVFEPDNPKVFYVNYSLKSANGQQNGDTIIARYRVTGNDPNVADPASEQIILQVDQPYANHNAGDLAFGPDHYLYIPLGDGGGGGDPDENAQDLSKLLGKILRLDVIGQSTYAIPSDNPYANDDNANTRDEIWAWGVRNPWRISFDRETHDLYIGDVGQGAWEEIDFQPTTSSGGENYGWDCYEGNHEYELVDCAATYVTPIFEYSHAENQSNPPAGCSSITGGYVYRGERYATLVGHYILADYCSGKFWSLIRNGQAQWEAAAHGKLTGSPSTFGEDRDGELYVADISAGAIYRVVDPTVTLPTPTVTPTVTPFPTIPPDQTERFYLPTILKSESN